MDFGGRWYMADLCRWGQVDPLAEQGYSRTPYHYVRNNPLAFVDPTGLGEDPAPLPGATVYSAENANRKKRKEAYDEQQRERDREYGLSSPRGQQGTTFNFRSNRNFDLPHNRAFDLHSENILLFQNTQQELEKGSTFKTEIAALADEIKKEGPGVVYLELGIETGATSHFWAGEEAYKVALNDLLDLVDSESYDIQRAVQRYVDNDPGFSRNPFSNGRTSTPNISLVHVSNQISLLTSELNKNGISESNYDIRVDIMLNRSSDIGFGSIYYVNEKNIKP